MAPKTALSHISLYLHPLQSRWPSGYESFQQSGVLIMVLKSGPYTIFHVGIVVGFGSIGVCKNQRLGAPTRVWG